MSGSRLFVGGLANNTQEKDLKRFFQGYGTLTDVFMKNGFGFVEFDNPSNADEAVNELNGQELLGERLVVNHARPSRGRGGGGGYRGGGGGGRFGGGGGYGGGGGGYDRGNRYSGGGGGGRERYGGRDNYRSGGGGGGRFGPPERTSYRLRVKNLSSAVTWQDLKDHMRDAGVEVSFADAHKQRAGEGVVDCSTESDMLRALENLDGMDIDGKKVRLFEERGGGSGSGSGSGDYGPSQRTRYRLRVENLSENASWQDLKSHMRSAGVECSFADAHKQRTGEGVVDFSTESDMHRALENADGMDIDGMKIRLIDEKRSGGGGGGGGDYGRPQRTRYRLRVENLSSGVTWQDLKDYMRDAGVEVSFADAHKQRTGEGCVDCLSESDMLHALEELDGMDIDGRKIRLIQD